MEIDILRVVFIAAGRKVLNQETHSYTLAYIALFEAAFKPRYCKTHAHRPLIHISTTDPPKASTQMIEAQKNARPHRAIRG
jgi:hypothetical protein